MDAVCCFYRQNSLNQSFQKPCEIILDSNTASRPEETLPNPTTDTSHPSNGVSDTSHCSAKATHVVNLCWPPHEPKTEWNTSETSVRYGEQRSPCPVGKPSLHSTVMDSELVMTSPSMKRGAEEEDSPNKRMKQEPNTPNASRRGIPDNPESECTTIRHQPVPNLKVSAPPSATHPYPI